MYIWLHGYIPPPVTSRIETPTFAGKKKYAISHLNSPNSFKMPSELEDVSVHSVQVFRSNLEAEQYFSDDSWWNSSTMATLKFDKSVQNSPQSASGNHI